MGSDIQYCQDVSASSLFSLLTKSNPNRNPSKLFFEYWQKDDKRYMERQRAENSQQWRTKWEGWHYPISSLILNCSQQDRVVLAKTIKNVIDQWSWVERPPIIHTNRVNCSLKKKQRTSVAGTTGHLPTKTSTLETDRAPCTQSTHYGSPT